MPPVDSGPATLPTRPVAIIVVTRNCLAALKITIESIRLLDDPRVWLVLVDGASTDGTAEHVIGLRGWARYAVSSPDDGIYDAMNKGWAAAPDDAHILYLGAGDLVLALPSAADLCGANGHPVSIALGECTVGTMRFRSRWGNEMKLRNTAHHQAMLVHKSVSPAAPFDTSLRVYGDWDFNLRLRERRIAARHVKGFLTHAEAGGASWRHDLAEIRRVATRHGGVIVGSAAFALNRVSRWRRDRAARLDSSDHD